MSQEETLLSGSIWSLTPEENARSLSLETNFSDEEFLVDANSGEDPSMFSAISGQNEPYSQDSEWALQLSDSSEESGQEGSPDSDISPEQGPSESSAQDVSPDPDITPEQGSSDSSAFISPPEGSDHKDYSLERSSDPPTENMEITEYYNNERASDFLDSPTRKRRAPDDYFATTDLGSSDEIPEYELDGTRQDSNVEPILEGFVHRDEPMPSDRLLFADIDVTALGNEVSLRKLPRLKRRRMTPERLREINEAWNEFYPDHLLDDSPNIRSPDCGALSVRLALEACLADAERILTERIPRALRNLKREEKLRDFHQSLSQDLTSMYAFVEGKALALIQQMKESCERLSELDKMVLPTASLESTVRDMVRAVTASASSIERLRVDQGNSGMEKSLLASQLELYQRVLEEIKAQNERHETELAEIEESCRELERAIEDAAQMRDKDPGMSEIEQGLETAQRVCDALQTELEEINDQIHEQKRILSFPDSLRLEKLMVVFREATSEWLAARGITLESITPESESVNSMEPLDPQKSLKMLADLIGSSNSVSTQTTIAMRHIDSIHSLIKITHDPPTLSSQRESQEKMTQNSIEADSNVFVA